MRRYEQGARGVEGWAVEEGGGALKRTREGWDCDGCFVILETITTGGELDREMEVYSSHCDIGLRAQDPRSELKTCSV